MPESSVDEAEKGTVSIELTASLTTPVLPRNSPPLHGAGQIDGPPEQVSTETKSLDRITAPPTAVQSLLKVRQLPEKSARRKTTRWIRFQLWFNTYRYVPESVSAA